MIQVCLKDEYVVMHHFRRKVNNKDKSKLEEKTDEAAVPKGDGPVDVKKFDHMADTVPVTR